MECLRVGLPSRFSFLITFLNWHLFHAQGFAKLIRQVINIDPWSYSADGNLFSLSTTYPSMMHSNRAVGILVNVYQATLQKKQKTKAKKQNPWSVVFAIFHVISNFPHDQFSWTGQCSVQNLKEMYMIGPWEMAWANPAYHGPKWNSRVIVF